MSLAPIEITISREQLAAFADRLGQLQDRLPQLIAWAANRATQAMKTQILVTSTAEGFQRKLARYRTRRPRASIGKPEAHILAGMIGWKWGRLLGSAQTRKAPGGLQVRIGRKTHFVPGGFVATMKTGHVGVFVRKPGWKWKTVVTPRGSERHGLPIKEVRTDSLTDIAEQSGRVPAIVEKGREVFLGRLNVEVSMLLAGISRPPETMAEDAA